ncbi:MAG: hypothetical protein LBH01_03995 [Verrucomicrobiales bacterium]|jgi:hypothetical protein|nr:hypothetical protein [Verrucomicrobiales bacterium]
MSKQITIDVSDEIMGKCEQAAARIDKMLPVAIGVPPVSLLQISLETAFFRENAESIARKFVKSLTRADLAKAGGK